MDRQYCTVKVVAGWMQIKIDRCGILCRRTIPSSGRLQARDDDDDDDD